MVLKRRCEERKSRRKLANQGLVHLEGWRLNWRMFIVGLNFKRICIIKQLYKEMTEIQTNRQQHKQRGRETDRQADRQK